MGELSERWIKNLCCLNIYILLYIFRFDGVERDCQVPTCTDSNTPLEMSLSGGYRGGCAWTNSMVPLHHASLLPSCLDCPGFVLDLRRGLLLNLFVVTFTPVYRDHLLIACTLGQHWDDLDVTEEDSCSDTR